MRAHGDLAARPGFCTVESGPCSTGAVADQCARGYLGEGVQANGKTTPKRRAGSKPTAAQQRARKEYVRLTGHKVTPKQVAKIRSQWVD